MQTWRHREIERGGEHSGETAMESHEASREAHGTVGRLYLVQRFLIALQQGGGRMASPHCKNM